MSRKLDWKDLTGEFDLIGKRVYLQNLAVYMEIELVGTIADIKVENQQLHLTLAEIFIHDRNKPPNRILIKERSTFHFHLCDLKDQPMLVDDTIWIPTPFDNLIIFCV